MHTVLPGSVVRDEVMLDESDEVDSKSRVRGCAEGASKSPEDPGSFPLSLSALLTARGAPPPRALARRRCASLGPRALSRSCLLSVFQFSRMLCAKAEAFTHDICVQASRCGER